MPQYQVSLVQGSNSVTEYIEAKNLAALLDFYQYASTMEVKKVLKVEYVNPSSVYPIDDFNYEKLMKVTARAESTGRSRQFIFHHLKKTVSDEELYAKMKECLEVGGASISSMYSPLRKA